MHGPAMSMHIVRRSYFTEFRMQATFMQSLDNRVDAARIVMSGKGVDKEKRFHEGNTSGQNAIIVIFYDYDIIGEKTITFFQKVFDMEGKSM